MSIRWWDESANLLHQLYACEHGVRLNMPPGPQRFYAVTAARTRDGCREHARGTACAGHHRPAAGYDWAHSIVAVPILAVTACSA